MVATRSSLGMTVHSSGQCSRDPSILYQTSRYCVRNKPEPSKPGLLCIVGVVSNLSRRIVWQGAVQCLEAGTHYDSAKGVDTRLACLSRWAFGTSRILCSRACAHKWIHSMFAQRPRPLRLTTATLAPRRRHCHHATAAAVS